MPSKAHCGFFMFKNRVSSFFHKPLKHTNKPILFFFFHFAASHGTTAALRAEMLCMMDLLIPVHNNGRIEAVKKNKLFIFPNTCGLRVTGIRTNT